MSSLCPGYDVTPRSIGQSVGVVLQLPIRQGGSQIIYNVIVTYIKMWSPTVVLHSTFIEAYKPIWKMKGVYTTRESIEV